MRFKSYKLPKGFNLLKTSPSHYIEICEICGKPFRTFQDKRCAIKRCDEHLPSAMFGRRTEKEKKIIERNHEFWNDFVWYYVAHNSGIGWVDPDQRRK